MSLLPSGLVSLKRILASLSRDSSLATQVILYFVVLSFGDSTTETVTQVSSHSAAIASEWNTVISCEPAEASTSAIFSPKIITPSLPFCVMLRMSEACVLLSLMVIEAFLSSANSFSFMERVTVLSTRAFVEATEIQLFASSGMETSKSTFVFIATFKTCSVASIATSFLEIIMAFT